MYQFMRRNNRKLLAIFAVFLMIVFILPPATKNMRGSPGESVIGTFPGGQTITLDQVHAAQDEWRLLNETVLVPNVRPDPQTRQPMPAPLASPYTMSPAAYAEISRNPPMFLLLLTEARKAGIRVSPHELYTTIGEINDRTQDE